MLDPQDSDNEISPREIPSFIEPRPLLLSNPSMRPRPQKGKNLLELFEEDSECAEPELVQVFLRLKPCNNPSNLYEVRSDRYLITYLDTTTAGHSRRTQHNGDKMYTFSQIFGPETNQKEIFDNVVKDNLKKLPEGNSFTLLTYGAPGSGKTYTLMGTVSSPVLVPRSLEYVFKVVDAAQTPVYKPSERGANKLSYVQQEYELQCMKKLQVHAPLKDKYRRMSVQLGNDLAASHVDLSNRSRHYIWVSFIEIYKEGIYDLLAPGERRNVQKLSIREVSSDNVYVKGATQAFVRSGEEAYDIMVAGKHNLQVAATGVHARSSRSHCIFTITMLTEGVSHVRLCDLAGCERAARTRNTGARMCELRAINSSLYVLERCLRALRTRQPAGAAPRQAHVPYRESKLTRLLGSGLSGARGEAVSIVVTLNPSPEYANETKHVLELAAVAKDIQIKNTVSVCPSSLQITQDTATEYIAKIRHLEAEIERLHLELAQFQSLKEVPKSETLLKSVDTKIESRSLATLEEQIAAEKLACVRLEEEVQHLRACLELQDEKADEIVISKNMSPITISSDSESEEDPCNESLEPTFRKEEIRDEEADEIVVSENVSPITISSDSESEEDPCNESFEPTFRKEDINKSRLLRQSAIQAEQSDSGSSMYDETYDTPKDESHDDSYETSEE